MKISYKEVSSNLDKLFFLPLSFNETIEQRKITIDSYLESVGWSWDDIVNEIFSSDLN